MQQTKKITLRSIDTAYRDAFGFTLLETLVALVVIAIGFLGMAGVMIRAMQVQKLRDHLDTSVKLARMKAGQVSQVGFNLLGTGTTTAEQELYGAASEAIVTIGPLNKRGEKSGGSAEGPFLYTTHLVVCKDNVDGGANAAGAGGDPCGNVSSSRPDELSCDVTLTDADQVRVRVVTSYQDQFGGCHDVNFDQIVINFE